MIHSTAAPYSALLACERMNSVARRLHPACTAAFSYSVFGHSPAMSGRGMQIGFAGQPLERDGRYLLGNGYRAYNAGLCRFHSPDSLSPFGEGDLNAYVYCGGDPVNRHDPSGHIYLSKGYIPFRFARRASDGVPELGAAHFFHPSRQRLNIYPSAEEIIAAPAKGQAPVVASNGLIMGRFGRPHSNPGPISGQNPLRQKPALDSVKSPISAQKKTLRFENPTEVLRYGEGYEDSYSQTIVKFVSARKIWREENRHVTTHAVGPLIKLAHTVRLG